MEPAMPFELRNPDEQMIARDFAITDLLAAARIPCGTYFRLQLLHHDSRWDQSRP
jgi:hypothetical protein